MKAPAAIACLVLLACLPQARAQNVRITPLGTRTGELCMLDRALMRSID